MNRNRTTARVLSIILAALPPVAGAQGSAPNAPAGASAGVPPRVEQKVPPPTRGDAPTEADARHCLELATNLEVIACAEKYRSQRRRG